MLDFSKLANNPVGVSFDKYIWEVHPRLARRKIFCEPQDDIKNFSLLDLDKLLRFVIVFIDPTSPLADEKDFEHRIRASMEALGFDERERFWKEVEGNTLYFHSILSAYFAMCHAIRYETWFSKKMAIHNINTKLRSGSWKTESEQRQALKMQDDLSYELIDLEHSLFPDEYTYKIIQEQATADKFVGYAEQYAEKIKQ